ncbi:hypothetical protein CGC20_31220 [Leishmania donovani]|uniref:Uncharacterized protein n=1 Tax=Leishmania donovani TaxID=5661 RepID=A0A504WX36_LEIDO|nr:hypothetical protein CGC20_31220 [Leishmania donovani]
MFACWWPSMDREHGAHYMVIGGLLGGSAPNGGKGAAEEPRGRRPRWELFSPVSWTMGKARVKRTSRKRSPATSCLASELATSQPLSLSRIIQTCTMSSR